MGLITDRSSLIDSRTFRRLPGTAGLLSSWERASEALDKAGRVGTQARGRPEAQHPIPALGKGTGRPNLRARHPASAPTEHRRTQTRIERPLSSGSSVAGRDQVFRAAPEPWTELSTPGHLLLLPLSRFTPSPPVFCPMSPSLCV